MSDLLKFFSVWVKASAVLAIDCNFDHANDWWVLSLQLSSGASVVVLEDSCKEEVVTAMEKCVQLLIDHERASKITPLDREAAQPAKRDDGLRRRILETISDDDE